MNTPQPSARTSHLRTSPGRPRHRLGIDIGGTFTDILLIDEQSGAVYATKVPTTPDDPADGLLAGVRKILSAHRVDAATVHLVVHATTVATNAIIEGNVASTAFVTTEGFSDLLEIGRQARPAAGLYDVRFEKPRPLVPRYLCYGVPERVGSRGEVLLPLDEGAARSVADQVRQAGVQAVAVCFLHSYRNPAHEARMGAILRAALPDVYVSLSADVAPEFREYFRASTTVVDASIRPLVSGYVSRIRQRLIDIGVDAELLIMQSGGGVYSADAAAERPVFMVESGPAAGVIAASYLGERLGCRDVVSFDMGGTTAKVALIQGGRPRITKEYEVGAEARAGTSGQAGSGYPIRTPVIDLIEIGAGGGSIAWVDDGGALRVGPHSAGAVPGPACYATGGDRPTVTDANLVLGRLNPDFFLGGELPLDPERATAAIARHCAGPLGLGTAEAAHAIVEIANTAMASALRLVSVQRGYDPRGVALMAFGGAGPLHANRLAVESNFGTVIIPPGPGVTSAMGLLVADLRREYTLTLIEPLNRVDPSAVEAAFQRLEAQGRVDLEREGTVSRDLVPVRQIELRYVGQSYELAIGVPGSPFDAASVACLLESFHRAHDRAYGFSAPGEPVEMVNLRVDVVGRIAKPRLRDVAMGSNQDAGDPAARRPVYFAEAGGFVECPVFDRRRVLGGQVLLGPAVCEEFDSTTVIHPGYQARVDGYGNLILSVEDRPGVRGGAEPAGSSRNGLTGR